MRREGCGIIQTRRRNVKFDHEQVIGYSLWVCILLSIVMVGLVKHNKQNVAKDKQENILKSMEVDFTNNPPMEYRILESKARLMRRNLDRALAGYTNVFRLSQTTNSIHFSKVIDDISKMQTALDEFDDNVDAMFLDAKIQFVTNNFLVEKIEDLEYKTFEHDYSGESLYHLKKAYTLLDKYRELWTLEDGELVFRNKELESAYYKIFSADDFPDYPCE